MSSSPSEKKSSDVEMGEANSALPTPATHEATPTFVAWFLSFKERLSRRSPGKEGGRIQPEVPAILSSPAMSTSAGGNKSPGDAAPLAESAMVPVQVPEVSAQLSGSLTTPVPAPKEEKATELMPPPLDRKEIVLGLPASSAAPLTKSRKRTGAATETVKKRRCTAGAEGEPSGPLSQHRAKIECSTRGLAESREALKQAEAALKSTEAARAAELSQLEVRVSDLERDLGKSASALFKLEKEKKSKASKVRRLYREIQNREESRTVVSRDDFHARLTRMAVLFDSLMAVREKDLALASVEGSLNEIHLLEGDLAPTLDSEEARLLSRKEELKASDGDFDSILSQLQFEYTLTPCSGETEGQRPVAEEGGDVASGRGNDEAPEGGDGCEVEDEGGAPRMLRDWPLVALNLCSFRGRRSELSSRSLPPDDHRIHSLLSEQLLLCVRTRSSKTGFRTRPRFTSGLRLCDDKSAFVLPDSYRYKVREVLSAYMTCLGMNRATSKGRLEVLAKILDFLV
ncbi:hypothetical protein YC2023_051057 [Brassica napus]